MTEKLYTILSQLAQRAEAEPIQTFDAAKKDFINRLERTENYLDLLYQDVNSAIDSKLGTEKLTLTPDELADKVARSSRGFVAARARHGYAKAASMIKQHIDIASVEAKIKISESKKKITAKDICEYILSGKNTDVLNDIENVPAFYADVRAIIDNELEKALKIAPHNEFVALSINKLRKKLKIEEKKEIAVTESETNISEDSEGTLPTIISDVSEPQKRKERKFRLPRKFLAPVAIAALGLSAVIGIKFSDDNQTADFQYAERPAATATPMATENLPPLPTVVYNQPLNSELLGGYSYSPIDNISDTVIEPAATVGRDAEPSIERKVPIAVWTEKYRLGQDQQIDLGPATPDQLSPQTHISIKTKSGVTFDMQTPFRRIQNPKDAAVVSRDYTLAFKDPAGYIFLGTHAGYFNGNMDDPLPGESIRAFVQSNLNKDGKPLINQRLNRDELKKRAQLLQGAEVTFIQNGKVIKGTVAAEAYMPREKLAEVNKKLGNPATNSQVSLLNELGIDLNELRPDNTISFQLCTWTPQGENSTNTFEDGRLYIVVNVTGTTN